MFSQDIAKLRLRNQHIAGDNLKTPEEVVAWMGAIQAQDYAMAKWGIGVRLPGATEAAIEMAIDEGKILRTHVLRPTWHMVAAADLGWMMDLTGPRLRGVLNANNKRMELTEAVFGKCNKIIARALGEQHMTRKELMVVLGQHRIATDDLRSSHIMFRAEIDGVVCSGVRVGKENSYALFEERVLPSKIIDRNEAVGELFKRYISSHGPATLHDFVWWSGLTLTDARMGLEENKRGLDSIDKDGKTWWFADEQSDVKLNRNTVHLLPAFDEYMVSYKDRSAALHDDHFSNAISSNGIFRPIIVVNGKVVGVWKRSVGKEKVVVDPVFFEGVSVPAKGALEKALQAYGRFLGFRAELLM
jgi:hypothetical protein